MSFHEKITAVLQRIRENTPHLLAASLVSSDGRLLVSLQVNAGDAQYAAMIAASNSLGRRLSRFREGEFEALLLQRNNGYTALYSVGPWAVLTVETSKKASLGLVHVVAQDATTELAPVFEEEVRRQTPVTPT